MLSNVEIDHLAHLKAFTFEDPTLILYDFTAEFPSISRNITPQALKAFGAPKEALQVMKGFYRNNHLHIKLHGNMDPGFTATRGIRQGCPLSPFIFAISSDSLLRVIENKMPQTQDNIVMVKIYLVQTFQKQV